MHSGSSRHRLKSCLRDAITHRSRWPGNESLHYFFWVGEISAAVAFVLGGDTANPAGECAPEASSGLDSGGVTGETYGPGSTHWGVARATGTFFPIAFALLRYALAILSWTRQSL